MHHCLESPDIVPLIVQHLDRRGLVVLARVCRSLSDYALDNLWRKQSGLTNLVKCFPQNSWEITFSDTRPHFHYWLFRFTRCLEPDDWERFHHYAHRIKELTYPNFRGASSSDRLQYDALDLTALNVLAATRLSIPMLPSLHTLNLSLREFPEEQQHIIFNILFGEKLKTLRVVASVNFPIKLLAYVPFLSPNVDNLTISGQTHDTWDVEKLSRIFTPAFNLRQCDMKMPDLANKALEVLRWLALFPNISTLGLSLGESFSLALSTKDYEAWGPAFQSVKELLIQADYTTFISPLLRLFSSAPLTSFDIQISAIIPDTDLSGLILTLTRLFDRNLLKRFHLSAIGVYEIGPLLSLSNLEDVSLDPTPPEMDNTRLRDMISSWPRLRRLKLCCEEWEQSNLTLQALILLADAYPGLLYVNMDLNAAEVPANPPQQSRRPARFRSLDEIFLQFSVMEHPRDVAAFLHELVPEHTAVRAWMSDRSNPAAGEMMAALASLRSAQREGSADSHLNTEAVD